MLHEVGHALGGLAAGGGMLDFITPGVGSLASGLIGAAGSLFGGSSANAANAKAAAAQMAFQERMVARQEAFQRESAQVQMDWQERMSSTAYQRAMGDMRAAGLNPMLAYQRGGASSPVGSAPTGASAGGASYHASDVVSPAVQTAMQGARMIADLTQMSAATANIESQKKLNDARALHEQARIEQTAVNTAAQSQGILTDKQRAELLRRQGITEGLRPGLVQAETGSAAATGRLTGLRADAEETAGDSWTGRQVVTGLRLLNQARAQMGLPPLSASALGITRESAPALPVPPVPPRAPGGHTGGVRWLNPGQSPNSP